MIGWGTIVLAVLMGFSGVMAGFMVLSMPDAVPQPARTPTDFIFEHFLALVVMQVVLAVVLLVAGRSLLRHQKWAARVSEAAAWLGLLYLLGVIGIFVYEFDMATSEAPHAPSRSFIPFSAWCLTVLLTPCKIKI